MTQRYDITVVISSFNRDDKVGATIERLFASDLSLFERVEVIVVDDGSPRPVEDILKRVGPPPPKMEVRVLTQRNSGIGATRNRGFRESKADLVLLLDDDILVKRSTLAEFVEAHREHPGAVIFGSYPFISHQSKSLREFASKLYGYDRISTSPVYERIEAITSGLLCVDKRKFNGSALYRDDLGIPAAEEHEVIYRFRKLAIPIYCALHISAVHNHHLELKWLVQQQYKYGMGTAEALIKYPQMVEIYRFSDLKSKLSRGGLRSVVKRIAASRIGRHLVLEAATLAQKFAPDRNQDRLLGLATTVFFQAGYNDGLARFALSNE